MISRIRGTLLTREQTTIEVMTPGGVGYQIQIPLSVYERLPREGAEVELRTVQIVRPDSVELFGFLDDRERELFGRLITAPGVGPRLALNVLSTLSPDRLVQAIADRDIASLRRVPGLGTKKAERLAVELAGKLDDLVSVAVGGAGPAGAEAEAAVGALVALGYTTAQAASAVRRVLDEDPTLAGGELIKAALARIGG